jgi:hypothetical protein
MFWAWWQITNRGFDEVVFGGGKGSSLSSVVRSRGMERAPWLVSFPVAQTESSFFFERTRSSHELRVFIQYLRTELFQNTVPAMVQRLCMARCEKDSNRLQSHQGKTRPGHAVIAVHRGFTSQMLRLKTKKIKQKHIKTHTTVVQKYNLTR